MNNVSFMLTLKSIIPLASDFKSLSILLYYFNHKSKSDALARLQLDKQELASEKASAGAISALQDIQRGIEKLTPRVYAGINDQVCFAFIAYTQRPKPANQESPSYDEVWENFCHWLIKCHAQDLGLEP